MNHAHSRTKSQRKPQAQRLAAANSYRCPACGEMVDNDDLEAIRFHHQHVLHPHFDLYASFAGSHRTGRESEASNATG